GSGGGGGVGRGGGRWGGAGGGGGSGGSPGGGGGGGGCGGGGEGRGRCGGAGERLERGGKGHGGSHPVPAGRQGAGLEAAPEQGHPRLHPGQAVALAVGGRVGALPVVDDLDGELVRVAEDPHLGGGAGTGVLEDVGEGFLDQAEQRD